MCQSMASTTPSMVRPTLPTTDLSMTPLAALPMPAMSTDQKPWFAGLAMRFRRFKRDTPGLRFERRYLAARAAGHGPVYKTMLFSAGLMLLSAGLVMLVAPGPGILVSVFGATLLAQQSRTLARLLDRSELRLRTTWNRVSSGQGGRTRLLSTLVVAGATLCAFAVAACAAVWLR